jgi:hypothetical protein
MKRPRSRSPCVENPKKIDPEHRAKSSKLFDQVCNTYDLYNTYQCVLDSIADISFVTVGDAELSDCVDIATQLLDKNIAPKIIELVYRFMVTWLPEDENYDMCGMGMEGTTAHPHIRFTYHHPYAETPPNVHRYLCTRPYRICRSFFALPLRCTASVSTLGLHEVCVGHKGKRAESRKIYSRLHCVSLERIGVVVVVGCRFIRMVCAGQRAQIRVFVWLTVIIIIQHSCTCILHEPECQWPCRTFSLTHIPLSRWLPREPTCCGQQ